MISKKENQLKIPAFSTSIRIQELDRLKPHATLGFKFSNAPSDSEKHKLQCKDRTFYYNKNEILQMLHKP